MVTYLKWRPWCISWGATDDEAKRELPGDGLVVDPDLITTRAMAIAAPPDAVWPWLVQMGPGRGGVYTYDWIENLLGLGVDSVDAVIPEYQHLAVGDAQHLGDSGPVITIVVLAQDNFPNKIARKEAFRSRIAVISNLDPLSFEDMEGMIAHRIETAGGAALSDLISGRALIEIYNITQGIPRDVCVLCDAAFVNAFVRAERSITPEIVAQTHAEMRKGKAWPISGDRKKGVAK